MKSRTLPNVIVMSVVYVGFLVRMQAVTPPPDGGYPGGNTAEGQSALFSLTSGTYNTAVGLYSLLSNSTGSFNTATGAGALLANTGDQNTALGAGTLLNNTTGGTNTATGEAALFSNTTGNENTATGASALVNNTTGFDNTAIGVSALEANTSGSSNIAIGALALQASNSTFNVAVGVGALMANQFSENTAVGHLALGANTMGGSNTAVGFQALNQNTDGNANTAIGSGAGQAVTTASHVTCIGADAGGGNVDNSTWIGNVFGVTTASGVTAPVIVSDTGQLGTLVSSERFKKDIASMEKASEAILSLRPVTFHYKSDTKGAAQCGLIAEEVAKVSPALVLPDKEGKPYTVRYDQVNAMLLNEFLNEHRKVQELEANAVRQQKQIEALTSGLQKISTLLATKQPANELVVKDH